MANSDRSYLPIIDTTASQRRADSRIARLILLNGPPGIGKSTCARQWVADRPSAVVVEIDELRTSIDGWRVDDSSKLLARQMAIEAADRLLGSGLDVVIPQYLGRPEFIVELERAAHAVGAQSVEVHLVADANEVVARFEARRATAGDAHPQHEVEDVRAEVADAIARLDAASAERAGVLRVAAGDGPNVTLARLSALLGQ
jgi:predicted kinase